MQWFNLNPKGIKRSIISLITKAYKKFCENAKIPAQKTPNIQLHSVLWSESSEVDPYFWEVQLFFLIPGTPNFLIPGWILLTFDGTVYYCYLVAQFPNFLIPDAFQLEPINRELGGTTVFRS